MRYFRIGEVPSDLYPLIGGKARGLDFLTKKGYEVPKGYIVTELENLSETDFDELLKAFKELGVKEVSVRSSASNEDGNDFSGAGQYETCLNVTEDRLIEAIKTCIKSLEADRVKAYQETFLENKEGKMNLVIQTMLDPSFAGVMFTVDPTNKDNVLIESVEGVGENLVSGAKSSNHYSINKTKFDIESKDMEISLLKKLYDEGQEIAKAFNQEVDLEWAIDKNNKLYWLQLRPITASGEDVSLDEFNPKNDLTNHLITTRNIGEMMPGAVTPLSISTSVLAIDYGMRNMLKEIGAIKRVNDAPDYFCALAIKNRLFIDLSALHTMSKKVMIASPDAMNLSILGEVYENCPEVPGKNAFFLTKFVNGIKFGKYLFSSKKAKKKIVELVNNLDFKTKETDGIKSIYKEIGNNLQAMNDALSYHYVCSSFSGSMNSALYMTLIDDFEDKASYQAFVSTLLSDIPGIESASILEALNEIAELIVKENPNAKELSKEELLTYVLDESHKEVHELYLNFLKKHGHRSIKEAELRSKAWKHDPLALMQNLKTVISSVGLETKTKKEFDIDEATKGLKKKGAIKWIATKARQAVVDREFTKSNIIKVIDKFKDRYILLSQLLKRDGYLSDEDSIYFLSHQEIGELINGNKELKRIALARRNKFKEAQNLRFDDIYVGKPEPLTREVNENEVTLKGIPVCKGIVYGKARVINSVEDALLIQKDEIMVAPFTDIGWSPYYSLVSALITEVGSALSHGAVVAREYALPTIVNVKNATYSIKTGDYLYVNANNGEVTLISEEEYKSIKGE